MKRFLMILLISVFGIGNFCFSLAGCASSEKTNAAFRQEALDETIKAIASRDDGKALCGLAVEAIRNGQTAYKLAVGYRYIDPKNENRSKAFTTDSKMRIASVSKTFVAVGIMQLYEQGKIDLDKDISEYLGFKLRNPSFPDTAISCRMLLSHTGSILDGETYAIPPKYSLKEFFMKEGFVYENGGHFDAYHKPGTYFEYSNLGFGVLGTVIESVSGQRFDKYMKEHILDPMGMTAGFVPGDFDAAVLDKVAAVYKKEWDKNGNVKEGSVWKAVIDDYLNEEIQPDTCMVSNPDTAAGYQVFHLKDYEPGRNATCLSPQGGLRISADELADWALMFANDGTFNGNQILKRETIDLMFTPHWTWDGNEENGNGDALSGLFQQWGLGIHLITNGMNNNYGDTFLDGKNIRNLGGHYGDAYGMFSVFFIDRENDSGFVYLCNGAECSLEAKPAYGKYSENWIWEEEIVTALYDTVLKDYAVKK